MNKFAVARLEDYEKWTPLACFASYDAADDVVDRWSDRYPNAWVDIIDLSTGELVD